MEKLIFGSDYPVMTAEQAIEGLEKINQFVEGTPLPKVSKEEIDRIIHRNLLAEFNLM